MTAALPSASTSTGRGVVLAVVAATVVACIVNTGISLVAQAMGADASAVIGLQPGAYIIVTLIGTAVGALGWVIIRNRAAHPAALLRWLVPVVVLVSMVPDLLLGLTVGWGALALALMHLVVAAVAVTAYRRFLPLA